MLELCEEEWSALEHEAVESVNLVPENSCALAAEIIKVETLIREHHKQAQYHALEAQELSKQYLELRNWE